MKAVNLPAKHPGIPILAAVDFPVILPRPVAAAKRTDPVFGFTIGANIIGGLIVDFHRVDGLPVTGIAVGSISNIVAGDIGKPAAALYVYSIPDASPAHLDSDVGNRVADCTGIV